MALARAVRTVKSVLFVCTGNICRSPIAEGLFRRLIGNRGDIDVVSAGVHAVRGQPLVIQRLGRDLRWFPYARSDGDWEPSGPPDPDPARAVADL